MTPERRLKFVVRWVINLGIAASLMTIGVVGAGAFFADLLTNNHYWIDTLCPVAVILVIVALAPAIVRWANEP